MMIDPRREAIFTVTRLKKGLTSFLSEQVAPWETRLKTRAILQALRDKLARAVHDNALLPPGETAMPSEIENSSQWVNAAAELVIAGKKLKVEMPVPAGPVRLATCCLFSAI